MEKKDLIEAEASMNSELETFRKQFNVEPDRFQKAVRFCEQVLEGGVKYKIYAEVFEVDNDKAKTLAGQFHRTKWVQELILFMRPNEHSLYFGERKRIIQAGMSIIDNASASNRDKTEAMKALQPFIKAEIAENDNEEAIERVGESISNKLTKQIEQLAKRGLMINDKGDIIEVGLLE